MEKPRVFVGSSKASVAIAERIRDSLREVADLILWDDPGFFEAGQATYSSITEKMSEFDFAILVFTPDDKMLNDDQDRVVYRPRDNVLLEFGLFSGGLGKERALIARPKPKLEDLFHIPIDLAGVTVAYLDPFEEGVQTLRHAILEKGHRQRTEKEIGVLYRLVNAITFPHYEDIHVPALIKAKIRYRNRETFDSIKDVLEFLGEMLTDYVFPRLNLVQPRSVRIYFAYYLGDGAADFQTDVCSCCDINSSGHGFCGPFVIGITNSVKAADSFWRRGRVISGYKNSTPLSITARVFQEGESFGLANITNVPEGVHNYTTPNELSCWAWPVEWRSDEGAGRVGTLAVSSSGVLNMSEDFKAVMDLLSKVIGFLFSLYGIRHRIALEQEAVRATLHLATKRGFSRILETDDGLHFESAIIGLRRQIAGYFEKALVEERKHEIKDDKMHVVGSVDILAG